MDRKLIGAWGEARAAAYLRDKGYEIVATGFRCRFGEIDLIATDSEFVAFVEVKTRRDARFAEAREFVDRHKQGRIHATARFWLKKHEMGRQPRFDVIEIYAPQGVETVAPDIFHLEDAFQ